MDQILDTPEENVSNLKFASWGSRLGAALLDGLIIVAVFAIVFFTFVAAVGLSFMESLQSIQSLSSGQAEGAVIAGFAGLIAVFLVLVIGVILYYALMESSKGQATLGKKAVGIIVAKENGDKLTFINALGRYFAKAIGTGISWLLTLIGLVSLAPVLSFVYSLLNYFWPLWDKKNQALHDKIAKTYVFKK
jgi:uncharacterized RDD family membrane protein YckC